MVNKAEKSARRKRRLPEAPDGARGAPLESSGVLWSAKRSQEPGECDNEPIELMWNRWQQRRHSPNHHYEDSPILSTQGGYLLQVLWYTTSSFSKVPEPSSSQYAYHAFLSRLMSGMSIVSCRLRKVERT